MRNNQTAKMCRNESSSVGLRIFTLPSCCIQGSLERLDCYVKKIWILSTCLWPYNSSIATVLARRVGPSIPGCLLAWGKLKFTKTEPRQSTTGLSSERKYCEILFLLCSDVSRPFQQRGPGWGLLFCYGAILRPFCSPNHAIFSIKMSHDCGRMTQLR